MNPRLNGVVDVNAARALEDARRADQARAGGEVLGPLHGLPITVKDSIDVAGFHCTAGARGAASRLPDRDAPAVARLRAGGAIIIAKTNLPELSEGFETDNLLFGRTVNAWDPTRSAGGSSGGEAAIVAAGGSAIGLGADTAGSARVPAHFNGVTTLKPTSARVPISGRFPPSRGTASARFQFAPFARRVGDLALALGVLAREDWRDAGSVAMPLGAVDALEVASLRVAFHAGNGMMTPSPATVAAIEAAARALAAAGAEVEEWRPPGLEATLEIMPGIHYGNDGGESLRALHDELGGGAMHPLLTKAIERAAAYRKDAATFDALLADWKSFRHAMLRAMESRDCILCPVTREAAPPHGWSLEGEDPLIALSPVLSWSLTGWPVVVVRAGTDATGLPIGVQLVARPWHEDVALATALAVEHALGPWPDPPLTRSASAG